VTSLRLTFHTHTHTHTHTHSFEGLIILEDALGLAHTTIFCGASIGLTRNLEKLVC